MPLIGFVRSFTSVKELRETVKKVRELSDQQQIMDDMIDALVELLEEKVILTTEEWEAKIKEKLNA